MEEADISLECIETSNTDAWPASDYKKHIKQEPPIRLGKASPTAVEDHGDMDELAYLDCHASVSCTGKTTASRESRETSKNGIKVHPPETFSKKMCMPLNLNESTVQEKFDGIGDSNKGHDGEKKDRVTHTKVFEVSKCLKGISLPYVMYVLIFVFAIIAASCFHSEATVRRTKRSNKVKWKASQPLGFGKTARLSCCTNDKNLLEKTWKFTGGPDNTILAFDNTSSQISKYGIQRQKNGFALLIYNLTQSDTNHLYTCSFGHYNSLSKTLVANDDHDDSTFDPPNVTIFQSSYDVNIGSSVTFSSNITSDLVFYDVYWTKKTGHDNVSTEVINSSLVMKYSGGDYNTSSLTILITDKNDTGVYTCNARNEYGTGTSSYITLTVTETNVRNIKVELSVGLTLAAFITFIIVIGIYKSGRCKWFGSRKDTNPKQDFNASQAPMIKKD